MNPDDPTASLTVDEQEVLLSAREYAELWEVIAALRRHRERATDAQLAPVARALVTRQLDLGWIGLRRSTDGSGPGQRAPENDIPMVLQLIDSWTIPAIGKPRYLIAITDAGQQAIDRGALPTSTNSSTAE